MPSQSGKVCVRLVSRFPAPLPLPSATRVEPRSELRGPIGVRAKGNSWPNSLSLRVRKDADACDAYYMSCLFRSEPFARRSVK